MYRYAAYALILILALLSAFGGGLRVGSDHEIAKQARTEQLIAATEKRTQDVVATAIAKMIPIQQTIRQKTETVIREVPIYRDCINDPAVERLLDAARANREPESTGSGSVP